MEPEVSFHRLAELELNEAATYYELEKPGLGARFLTEVDRCVESLVKNPRAGGIVLGDVRRRLIRRFPYALLYTIRRQCTHPNCHESKTPTAILGWTIVSTLVESALEREKLRVPKLLSAARRTRHRGNIRHAYRLIVGWDDE